MSDELCTKCSLREPLNGYICEWCTMEELHRIRHLPIAQVRPALDAFDVEKYGFVRPLMTPQDEFRAATDKMRKLGEKLRDLGVDVEPPADLGDI